MNRRQERSEALSLIFEAAFNTDTEITALIDTAEEIRGVEITDYIRETVRGVFISLSDIDDIIARHLKKGWKAERLSQITKAILRYAVYEMLYSDSIPQNIAINEAVELAKIYADDDSPAFINGVLGGVSRSETAKKAAAEITEKEHEEKEKNAVSGD